MGIFGRLIGIIFGVLTLPFRLLGRLFGRGASTTARKAIGGAAATDADIQRVLGEKPEVSLTFPFRALERPRLSEQSASDLSLESAENFVSRAHRFYSSPFDLFPRSSLFYEEVEADELAHALAADDPNSTDSKFVIWMGLFRRTLNDNARRLLVYYAPLIFVVVSAIAVFLVRNHPSVSGLPGVEGSDIPSAYVFIPGSMLIGLFILVLLYQWPFKVVIQRNLLGLDNYITSRFSRINQNFQVAKRFALNVERNKRMSQADELKYEAGVWTVAYNWFAMRLYLCERVVRSQMYQVARNATLYALGGLVLTLILGGAVAALWMFVWPIAGDPMQTYGVYAISALIYTFIAYLMILGGAPGEAARVLSDNEWFRFAGAELDRTIADHVGEDKLQIVTFRDRNRME